MKLDWIGLDYQRFPQVCSQFIYVYIYIGYICVAMTRRRPPPVVKSHSALTGMAIKVKTDS